MNGKPIPRNKDGLIELACIDCGRMRYSKKGIPRPLCKSCGIKKSFKSRPAVGLKNIGNMDQVIKEYESNQSLWSLGKKYGVSAITIRAKLIAYGKITRSRSETAKRTHKRYNTISQARSQIEKMCATGEFQKNMSARLQGIPVEEWEGFTTPENKRLIASPEYKQWQKSVFERDNHTCQLCRKTKCPIAAHHIYMKARYPDRVLDIDNGITLCDKCHHKTIGSEDEYVDQFVGILLGDLCGKKH